MPNSGSWQIGSREHEGGCDRPHHAGKRLRKTVKKEWWPVVGFLTAGVKELGRLCLLAGGLGADPTTALRTKRTTQPVPARAPPGPPVPGAWTPTLGQSVPPSPRSPVPKEPQPREAPLGQAPRRLVRLGTRVALGVAGRGGGRLRVAAPGLGAGVPRLHPALAPAGGGPAGDAHAGPAAGAQHARSAPPAELMASARSARPVLRVPAPRSQVPGKRPPLQEVPTAAAAGPRIAGRASACPPAPSTPPRPHSRARPMAPSAGLRLSLSRSRRPGGGTYGGTTHTQFGDPQAGRD